jgi:2-dehydro-3-deoxyphosphogluconate aldolase / (4S)-4-hydroxy-2-oxoglutarate aldolase
VDVLGSIRAARVVPVVRRPSAVEATELCERLLALGTPVIELTATTPDWPSVLNRLLWRTSPGTTIGVGTVDAAPGALLPPKASCPSSRPRMPEVHEDR